MQLISCTERKIIMPDKPIPGGYKQRQHLQRILDQIAEVEDLLDEIIAPVAAGDRKWTHQQIALFRQVSRKLQSMGDSAFIAQRITEDYDEEKKIIQYKRRTGG